MKLIHGNRYQGLAVLPWPVSSLASEERASAYLKDRGWVDVAVWDDADKLPPTWPANRRDGDVFVKATWAGPTGDVQLPSQVTWVIDLGPVPMLPAISSQIAAGKAAGQAAYEAAKRAEASHTESPNDPSGQRFIVYLLVAAITTFGLAKVARKKS